MERFTYKDNTGEWTVACTRFFNYNRFPTRINGEAIDRLAAYEDTGLEPQEITRIVDEYGHGHTLRTHAAERLELIREIPTDRLRDLVHEEEWVNALVYDLYRLLLSVDEGIRKKDLSILRPPSRPGAPENGIPFQRRLSKLETDYEELLNSCCRYEERKRKSGTEKKEA